MARYRNPCIEELSMQLRYSPPERRREQLERIATLVRGLDPAISYSYEYVCSHITRYRPQDAPVVALPGESLRRDLVRMLDDLSATLNIPVESVDQPVYTTKQIRRLFSISEKTLFRWRKEGLPSRKFVFEDGRKRTGILKSDLEAFVSENKESVRRSSRFTQLTEEDRNVIFDKAAEYVKNQGLGLSAVTNRLSKELGRARETIRYTLKKYDGRNGRPLLFPAAGSSLSEEDREAIYRACREGEPVTAIAKRYGRSRSTIHRVALQTEAHHILQQDFEHVFNEDFERPDAEELILGDEPEPTREDLQPPDLPILHPEDDVPAYLHDLYAIPLLTKDEELEFFRRYNYCKYRASKLRDRLNPLKPSAVLIGQINRLRRIMLATKNRIIEANLRLVVSIAKHHVGRVMPLSELVSDGNISLMKAVEKFDYGKGWRFSTYATHAIRMNFAKTVPDENYNLDRFMTGRHEVLDVVPDPKAKWRARVEFLESLKDAISQTLEKLTAREREIIKCRFGIGETEKPQTLEEVGSRLNVTRERVRQIERKALRKLEIFFDPDILDQPGY